MVKNDKINVFMNNIALATSEFEPTMGPVVRSAWGLNLRWFKFI
jgi:hypothetical protein